MENKYLNIASEKTSKLNNIIKSFSLTEKLIISILALVFIVSTLAILIKVNNNFLVEVPDRGGSLVEGIIGTPRFINPVIANSSVDRDLASIIYSGLIKVGSDGQAQPDLAERYEVSEDGLIYDFYLREDVEFHDGEPVTANDVVFTILKIQDPKIRSPHISDWEGVAIEKVSDRQIRFILDEPDPDFLLENNIGILPRHLWLDINAEAFSLSLYNREPIGSGPYKIDKVRKDTIDIPQSYVLESYKDYALGRPLIDEIVFKFAKNEEELVRMVQNKEINAIKDISPKSLEEINLDDFNVITASLPRVFGLFINQSESPALSINSARKALRLATPKTKIIEEVFNGYANKINSPLPNLENSEEFQQDLEEAEQILIDAGWEKNDDGIYVLETDDESYILSTSISTGNIPDLTEVAEMVAKEWRKIGVEVSVKIFNTSDLNQNVIRPRNFEVLLFGNVITSYSDLYSFWHSSGRNDPGLNITNYANIETDSILDDFLNTMPSEITQEDIDNFTSEIREDVPAIFLYNPQFVYLISKDIKGIDVNQISTTSDRFNNINNWFINTDKVWQIFAN